MGFECNIGDMIITNWDQLSEPNKKLQKTRYGVILGFIDYNLKTNYVPIDGPQAHKKFRIYWNETNRKGKISIVEEKIVKYEVERGHWMLVTNRGESYNELI